MFPYVQQLLLVFSSCLLNHSSDHDIWKFYLNWFGTTKPTTFEWKSIFNIRSKQYLKAIETVGAYLRSLWTRTAEEKNILRPSKELMNCKQNTIKFIFHVSPNFHVTDPYHIGITLVNWSTLIRNSNGTNGYSQRFSFQKVLYLC